MNKIELRSPYLIFLGAEEKLTFAKTGAGLVEWRRELCKGQLRLTKQAVDLCLPSMSLREAADAGVGSLIIGTAAIGGGIPESWLEVLEEALMLGLDIVAGVHSRLSDIPRLKRAAEASGSRLIDVRVPPQNLPVGTGKKRRGMRLLTVGTDCAIGKKYTALALERDMKKAGINVDFRASGQTGIMIAGSGIPIDSVVCDFISGAAEMLSPENSDDHWDVIEGQGAIFHPGYCAVTMGLLVGSQPDAFVVCHEAGRTHISGWEDFPLPTLEQVIERTVAIGSQVNPAIRCVGISVNTSGLDNSARENYLAELSSHLELPCIDPLHGGTGKIITHLQTIYG